MKIVRIILASLALLFSLHQLQAAAGGGAAGGAGAVELPEGKVREINSGLFIALLEKDLYVVMERVTPESLEKWKVYKKLQNAADPEISTYRDRDGFLKAPYAKAYHDKGDAFEGLGRQLVLYEYSLKTKPFEFWFAYIINATEMPNKLCAIEDMDNIEMAMTVSTDETLPFTMHMGISRGWRYMSSALKEGAHKKVHRNISVKLHGFAGKVMHMRHPDKIYMITGPMHEMRKILIEALPMESIWFGTKQYYEALGGHDIHHESNMWRRKEFFLKKTSGARGTVSVYEAGEKILAKKYSPISSKKIYSDYDGEWTLEDPTGKVIFHQKGNLKTDFPWFFTSWASAGDGYFIVTLTALADFFDHTVGTATTSAASSD